MAVELREAHRALLEHFKAREFDAALSAADQVLALADGSNLDPELRALVAGASAMWLQLRVARGADDELLDAAGEMYARFAADDRPEALVAAATAAVIRIHLLIKSGQRGLAQQQASELEALYRARPTALNGRAIAGQMLQAVYFLLAAQRPESAALLARAVVDRFEGQPDSARVAAAAQVWVVIAAMYRGETNVGAEVPPDEETLRSMSVDELCELSPMIAEAERLQAMGQPAVAAIDAAVKQLQRSGQWDRALLTILALKIETLRELDQPDELRAALQQCIDTCSGIEKWNAPQLLDQFRRDLAEL